MLLKDLIEDSVREKRKYDKSGAFSKKKRTYVTEGEFKNIVMSLKAYQTWIDKSRKNDKITYYRGYIVEPSIQPIAPTMDRKRVEKLQTAVFNTYLSNLVTLVQKRHGKLDYEYIAVRK
jgi:hypothetical protein|tara:strand:- start:343 stop:699 length:357 start_codon:yes stop_codon:yes gene_type:complete